jgi:hypothetical protein
VTSWKCWVERCAGRAFSWGMCLTHRQLWDWHVRIPRTRLIGVDDPEKFEHYAIKNMTSQIASLFGARPDCWAWGGGLHRNGFGVFRSHWSLTPDGSVFAYLYSRANLGKPGRGAEVRIHPCSFRPCVNWKHLRCAGPRGERHAGA